MTNWSIGVKIDLPTRIEADEATDAEAVRLTGDLSAAIAEFAEALPGWWFSVGFCGVSRDASCGPDYSRNRNRLVLDAFDDGFHADLDDPKATLADALRCVTKQAKEALVRAAQESAR